MLVIPGNLSLPYGLSHDRVVSRLTADPLPTWIAEADQDDAEIVKYNHMLHARARAGYAVHGRDERVH